MLLLDEGGVLLSEVCFRRALGPWLTDAKSFDRASDGKRGRGRGVGYESGFSDGMSATNHELAVSDGHRIQLCVAFSETGRRRPQVLSTFTNPGI